jgi:S1-C subfamily serine protease
MATVSSRLTHARPTLVGAFLVLSLAAAAAFSETRIRSYTPGLAGPPVGVHVSDGLRRVAQAVAASLVTVHGPSARRGGPTVERLGALVGGGGSVVTTADGLRDGGLVRVVLADGRAVPARALRRDAGGRLAVLTVDGGGTPALPTRRAESGRAGDLVMVVTGRAGGDATARVGVLLSAPGRPGRVVDAAPLRSDLLLGPDSVGAPLVNAHGEVLGIVAAGAGRGGEVVPIDGVRPLLRAGGTDRG